MKSTNGDTHLGGDNLDQRIVDWLIDEFKKDEGLDLRGKGNEMALQRLRDAAERAKIELSTTMETESTCRSSRRMRAVRSTCEEADPREAGIDGRRHDSAFGRSVQTVHEGCGRRREQDQRSRARRRTDPHAPHPELVKELFGKEPPQGRESG